VSEQIGFDFESERELIQNSVEETPQEILEQDVLEEDVTEEEIARQSPVELEKNGQIPLINIGEWWEEHWKQMPEFVQKDISPFKTIYVHFETRKDMEDFIKLVGQRITLDTKSIWYPEADSNDFSKKRYADAYQPGAESA
jgi:hypothetical protein